MSDYDDDYDHSYDHRERQQIRHKAVVIIGAPKSGKTTLAQRITKDRSNFLGIEARPDEDKLDILSNDLKKIKQDSRYDDKTLVLDGFGSDHSDDLFYLDNILAANNIDIYGLVYLSLENPSQIISECQFNVPPTSDQMLRHAVAFDICSDYSDSPNFILIAAETRTPDQVFAEFNKKWPYVQDAPLRVDARVVDIGSQDQWMTVSYTEYKKITEALECHLFSPDETDRSNLSATTIIPRFASGPSNSGHISRISSRLRGYQASLITNGMRIILFEFCSGLYFRTEAGHSIFRIIDGSHNRIICTYPPSLWFTRESLWNSRAATLGCRDPRRLTSLVLDAELVSLQGKHCILLRDILVHGGECCFNLPLDKRITLMTSCLLRACFRDRSASRSPEHKVPMRILPHYYAPIHKVCDIFSVWKIAEESSQCNVGVGVRLDCPSSEYPLGQIGADLLYWLDPDRLSVIVRLWNCEYCSNNAQKFSVLGVHDKSGTELNLPRNYPTKVLIDGDIIAQEQLGDGHIVELSLHKRRKNSDFVEFKYQRRRWEIDFPMYNSMIFSIIDQVKCGGYKRDDFTKACKSIRKSNDDDDYDDDITAVLRTSMYGGHDFESFKDANNNIEDLKRILQGFDITATDEHGCTCVEVACKCSSAEIMKLVLEQIAALGGPSLLRHQLTKTTNCLMFCCGNSSCPEVIMLLIDKIVELGGPELLQSQLTATDDYSGRTCLMAACSNSSPEVVKLLAVVLFYVELFEMQYKKLDNYDKYSLKEKTGIDIGSWTPDTESLAAVKAILYPGSASKKKADEAATAKKKADEAATAKKKADEAATAKKKADEAATAKKKADEAATAKKKKAEEVTIGSNEKVDASSITVKKKAAEEAADKKKADEEAADKKRADELAAAKKKTAEEAALRKRAEEQAVVAKKSAQEAASAKKKAEEQAAVWKQKYCDILATTKKIEEEAATKKAEQEALAKKKASCFICNHLICNKNTHSSQTLSEAQIDSIINKLAVSKSTVKGKLNSENLIGQGSSAKVFQCSVENWSRESIDDSIIRCTEHSPQLVAFKVFHHVDDAAIKAELKTSLQGAAGCPHILAPIGYCRWETDDGEPRAAILLPRAEKSLAEVSPLDRTKASLMDVADRLDGLLSVCKAVQHLHNKRNIIHRDIKPQNVFVLRSADRKFQYKLGDLGASKKQPMSASLTTKTNRAIGTVAYMSPEQLLGQPATRASDIYSLGLTLFKSLSEDCTIPEKFLDNEFIFRDAYRDGKIKIDPPTLPDCVSKLGPAFAQLSTTIKNCFDSSPSKRPSADDLAAALAAAAGVTSLFSERY